jgi:mannose-6-phosphate isomerase-like protein (cupin superfamily)
MWSHHEISDLDARRAKSGKTYLEFLREETLSAGLYSLRAGEEDLQKPHTEDEVYYVVEGKARFRCDGEDCDVGTGSTLFVKAGVDHRFHAIVEDLKVLVLFAPPEGVGSS